MIRTLPLLLALLLALPAAIEIAVGAEPGPAPRQQVSPLAVPAGLPPPAERGWIGVSLDRPRPPEEVSENNEEEASADLLAVPEGVPIAAVVRDSPADDAGLHGGDIVLAVDGQPVESSEEFVRAVATRGPGAWIELEVWRNGSTRRVTARLEPFPESPERFREIKIGWAGIDAVDVPLQLRERWGGSEGSGVLVGAVAERGPAELGGVLPGDLVLRIDGEPVASAAKLAQRIARAGDGAKLELQLSRQGTGLTVDVLLDREPPEEAAETLRGRNRVEGSGRRPNGR